MKRFFSYIAVFILGILVSLAAEYYKLSREMERALVFGDIKIVQAECVYPNYRNLVLHRNMIPFAQITQDANQKTVCVELLNYPCQKFPLLLVPNQFSDNGWTADYGDSNEHLIDSNFDGLFDMRSVSSDGKKFAYIRMQDDWISVESATPLCAKSGLSYYRFNPNEGWVLSDANTVYKIKALQYYKPLPTLPSK